MNWSDVASALFMAGLIGGSAAGILTAGSLAVTGNPLAWTRGPDAGANSPCNEGIHATHNGQPIANLAIKQLGSGIYTWAVTNSSGYGMLSICSPVGAIITFQATDYAFQLEPHQIIEAKL